MLLRHFNGGDDLGKARSYEIIEYRKKIMDSLCRDKEILKLFNATNLKHPEDELPYHKFYPHEYIPETITSTERFICFDIRATHNTQNRTLTELIIYFFISCHQDVVPYFEDGRSYLWYDKVVCALDELFTDQYKLGIGKMELISNDPYYPQQKFKGRKLMFRVSDFYNGKEYGK